MNAFRREDVPLYLTGAAAVCCILSISASQILMALALLALIVTRQNWRIPPIWVPLSVFVAGTLIPLAASRPWWRGGGPAEEIFALLVVFFRGAALPHRPAGRAMEVGRAGGAAPRA